MAHNDPAPDDVPALSGVLDAVGPRLRALRQKRGVTLAQLSESTGISVSTLSRLESGQRRPTLELLLLLSRAHQVPLDELVDAPPAGDPRIYPRPVTFRGMTVLPLTRRPGGIQAYKMIIPPHWPPVDPGLQVHEGYEWFYVMSGRLRLRLGEQDMIIKVGEAAEFDTHVPHGFSNPDPHPVELLSLFGAQGERLHIRARSTTEPQLAVSDLP
jgi:transcriptional regulator with XRE-family HTH domain